MPYTIRLSDGAVLTTLADRAIDRSTLPLALVGRGAVNYGTDFAENFVYLLENFASTEAPVNPLVGQLWFDRTTNQMRYYIGTWELLTPITNQTLTVANIVTNSLTVTGSIDGSSGSAGKWTTPRTLTLTGDATGHVTFDGSTDFSLPVSIPATISVPQATNANFAGTANTANFAGVANSAGTALFANAANTAARLSNARTIALTGPVTGSASFDGTGDIAIATAISNAAANGLNTNLTRVTKNNAQSIPYRGAAVNVNFPGTTPPPWATWDSTNTTLTVTAPVRVFFSVQVTFTAFYSGAGYTEGSAALMYKPLSASSYKVLGYSDILYTVPYSTNGYFNNRFSDVVDFAVGDQMYIQVGSTGDYWGSGQVYSTVSNDGTPSSAYGGSATFMQFLVLK